MEDDGTTVALVRNGVTDLVRIAGMTHLTRKAGGISLARIARKATQASHRCRRSQGETRTATKTRGLGASRSRA